MTMQQMAENISKGRGFIAALDQSGGSTPKALRLYGIDEGAYGSDDQMFDLIHTMRSRIVNSPAFTGDRVVGAILFEMTMDREIGGKPSAKALWEDNGVVPFLKIDNGLAEVQYDAQILKPIPGLSDLLARASEHGIFGSKKRSVINRANPDGVKAVVQQQFEIGSEVLNAGMVPIIEPEVSITAPDKAAAEDMLLQELSDGLDGLPEGKQVMFKLTLPEQANVYKPLIDDPRVMKVVALSGGYARAEANARLSKNSGMIASFSRALTEGLTAQQDDAAFDETLNATIQSIYDASVAG